MDINIHTGGQLTRRDFIGRPAISALALASHRAFTASVEKPDSNFNGVQIGANISADEVNYCFTVAKALGARGITTEISEENARFLAPFAETHQIMIGFHNHTQVNASSWNGPFSFGKYIGMNFDIGHYVAGTNESPIPIIEKYAAQGRILSLHIKDRKVNDVCAEYIFLANAVDALGEEVRMCM